MLSVPQFTSVVKVPLMSMCVREQILDVVLAQEIERLERRARREEDAVVPPASAQATAFLPGETKVSEVLENGGFTFVKRKDGSEVYEYERISRDGQPLKGKEMTRPPRYTLVRWGSMILRCTCDAARGTSAPCKHQRALAWWLGLPMQNGANP